MWTNLHSQNPAQNRELMGIGAARPRRILGARSGLGCLAILVLTTALVVGAIVAVDWLTSGDERDLEAARAMWEANEPASYSFSYEACSGMCAGCDVRISVRDGRVVGTKGRLGDCDEVTIEDVFDRADHLINGSGYASVTVGYDGTYGFPNWGRGDCDEGTVDCGTGFAVTDFQVAP